MGKLVFKPVDRTRKDDFIRLFDAPGWQKQCWCMVWRATPEEGRGTSGKVRRGQMLGRIEENVPVGLIGYDGDEPVAWVSIAPKHTYQRLGGPEPKGGENIWSLACMMIRRDHRGRGLGHDLIAAAVEHAKAQGATAVEAYPVDPDSPSYT